VPIAAARPRVEIRLLGPLEALVDGRPVAVGGPQPRAVLSLLALNAGTPVSWDSLVDAVWGDGDPPAGAANSVQVYVSRLRRALAPTGAAGGTAGGTAAGAAGGTAAGAAGSGAGAALIRSGAGGYVLDIPPDAVDARRFETLAARGHDQLAQGAPDAARETLAEALATWRGRPFPDLDGANMPAMRARLEAQHVAAQTEHAEALLALGRTGQAVAELERLVQLHPLDEGLVVRLMTALYQAGRQADALSAYGLAASRLAEELGVDPGAILRQTHEAVLRQTLNPPLSTTSAMAVGRAGGAPREERSLERLRRPRGELVGRRAELQQAVDLLADPAVRIVTLVGPGGIGKTRLALAVADRIAAEADGSSPVTAIVPLASVSDPAEVLALVAQGIGAVPEWPGQDLVELLAEVLTDRPTVIVLDNVEQLVGDPRLSDALVELLERAPGLTLLLTSRIAMRLRDEHQIPLGPLPVPDEDDSALDEVGSSESVQLFVERARGVAPDFALTAANAADVAELCRMLDGQPLALELAAARVRVLPPQDMVRRTGRLLQLLTGGSVDLPDRQRSMRAALDGSAQLLDEVELSVFGQLSVFVGGWTVAAAEQVCLCPEDVVDVLTRLVDKSLVVADGSGRLSMLDTVREYAAERLSAAGGDLAAELRQRHARFYAEFAADVGYRYQATPDSGRRALLDAEAGNLTAALAHAAESGDRTSFHRLVVGTLSYWFYTGRVAQGERWLALTDASELPPDLRAQVLVVIGNVALVNGDPVRAGEPLDGAVQAAREVGDPFLLARVLSIRGLAHRHTGQPARALEHTEEALAVVRRQLAEEPGAPRFALLLGLLQNERGEILDHLGSSDEARAMFEAYRKQAVVDDDPSHLAWALINIALNEGDRGHHALARELMAAAMRAADEGGSTPIEGDAHMAAGLLELLVDGDPAAAVRHEAQAARMLQSSGLLLTLPDAVSLLGAALLRSRQHADAARMLAAGAAWRASRSLVVVSRPTQNVIVQAEAELAAVRLHSEGSPLARSLDEEAARGAAAPYGWLEALDLPEVGEAGRVEIHLVDLSRSEASAKTAP
jgi:predicted ATPase/DNA-binding SARP family transcriptional activator